MKKQCRNCNQIQCFSNIQGDDLVKYECPSCRRNRENLSQRVKNNCPITKICAICEKEKTNLEFNIDHTNSDCLSHICIECGKDKNLVLKNRNKIKHICTHCKEEKTGDNFPVMKNAYTTIYPTCKICIVDYRTINGIYTKQIKNRQEKCLTDPKFLEREKINESRRHNQDPRVRMIRESRKRAKNKGWEHDIIKEDLFIPEFCPILKIPLFCGTKENYENSPSLDRIDNSKGYIKGNVHIISKKANSMKNSGTKEELLLLAKWISKNINI